MQKSSTSLWKFKTLVVDIVNGVYILDTSSSGDRKPSKKRMSIGISSQHHGILRLIQMDTKGYIKESQETNHQLPKCTRHFYGAGRKSLKSQGGSVRGSQGQ